MKILLIGPSGSGKSTFFAYLAAGVEPDFHVPNKRIKTTEPNVGRIQEHPEIELVDSPGLDSADLEWWQVMHEHKSCDYIIFMLAGTVASHAELGTLRFILPFIQTYYGNTRFTVFSIKGRDLDTENFTYQLLRGKDHYGDHGTPRACVRLNVPYPDAKEMIIKGCYDVASLEPMTLSLPVQKMRELFETREKLKTKRSRIQQLKQELSAAADEKVALENEKAVLEEEKAVLEDEKAVLEDSKQQLEQRILAALLEPDGAHSRFKRPRRRLVAFSHSCLCWAPFSLRLRDKSIDFK